MLREEMVLGETIVQGPLVGEDDPATDEEPTFDLFGEFDSLTLAVIRCLYSVEQHPLKRVAHKNGLCRLTRSSRVRLHYEDKLVVKVDRRIDSLISNIVQDLGHIPRGL